MQILFPAKTVATENFEQSTADVTKADRASSGSARKSSGEKLTSTIVNAFIFQQTNRHIENIWKLSAMWCPGLDPETGKGPEWEAGEI